VLVLTRKVQQQIHVGDNIVITILQVKGNCVRVGIEAPMQVRIARGELHNKAVAAAAQASAAGESKSATSVPAKAMDHAVETIASVVSPVAGSMAAPSHRSRVAMPHSMSADRASRNTFARPAARSFSRPDRVNSGGTSLHSLVAARRQA